MTKRTIFQVRESVVELKKVRNGQTILHKERRISWLRSLKSSKDQTREFSSQNAGTVYELKSDGFKNTFMKIYKNINNFKGDSKLYSWMYGIATNEAITHLNKNAKRLQITNEAVQEYAINNLKADVYFEGDEIQLKLQRAIATLPQKQQLVFNMKYFDNIKYKDMSKVLETSEGALKASYHIAVKKIETCLTSI